MVLAWSTPDGAVLGRRTTPGTPPHAGLGGPPWPGRVSAESARLSCVHSAGELVPGRLGQRAAARSPLPPPVRVALGQWLAHLVGQRPQPRGPGLLRAGRRRTFLLRPRRPKGGGLALARVGRARSPGRLGSAQR